MMTKGEMMAAWDGLPDDTILEIHVPNAIFDGSEGAADYTVENAGVVAGSASPLWFNIRVGEFVTECE